MGGRFPFLSSGGDGAYIKVIIQPRASRDEIAACHDDFLKIRLTAPPVEDRANRGCIEFLARLLKVKKSGIDIVQGKRSRRKVIRVSGLSLNLLENLFDRILKHPIPH